MISNNDELIKGISIIEPKFTLNDIDKEEKIEKELSDIIQELLAPQSLPFFRFII